MAFCTEHPKWEQNPNFTPLSKMTNIHALSYRSPPGGFGSRGGAGVEQALFTKKQRYFFWTTVVYG